MSRGRRKYPKSAIPKSVLSGLGAKIKATRLAANMNQQTLAAACGLTRTSIGNIERDTQRMTLDTAIVLAGKLGVSLAELIDQPPPVPIQAAPTVPCPWCRCRAVVHRDRSLVIKCGCTLVVTRDAKAAEHLLKVVQET